MVSNAPHNPTHTEVEEPTQPYSRAKIERLRRAAKPSPQEQRLDTKQPNVPHRSPREMLTVVPDATDKHAGDHGMQEWFELEGRRFRVCLPCFAHFGLSGAPPGMLGAVDANFVSGTIGGERSAALHLGPQRLEVEPAKVDQAPAPKLEPENLQPFARRHKWKLWVLVASPLALALAAWIFARHDAGPAQPMTRDTQQVRADGRSEPTKVPIELPIALPIALPIGAAIEAPALPAPEPDEIPSRDEVPSKAKARKDFGACVEHRKSAMDAKDGGDWARLLDLAARRHNCWSRVSANALQMEALFELGRYRECVQLGARDGSKREIQKWRNACQLNL